MKVALGIVLALLVAAGCWFYVSFTVYKTNDGYLVMNERQSKECEEGGGCQVFSQREFVLAFNNLFRQQQQRRMQES